MKTMPKVGDKIWYVSTVGDKIYCTITPENIYKKKSGYLLLDNQFGDYKSIIGGIVRKVKKKRIEGWVSPVCIDKEKTGDYWIYVREVKQKS